MYDRKTTNNGWSFYLFEFLFFYRNKNFLRLKKKFRVSSPLHNCRRILLAWLRNSMTFRGSYTPQTHPRPCFCSVDLTASFSHARGGEHSNMRGRCDIRCRDVIIISHTLDEFAARAHRRRRHHRHRCWPIRVHVLSATIVKTSR